MGGVVSRFIDAIPLISRHLDIDNEALINTAREEFDLLTEGRITTRTFWDRFSCRSGKPVVEELFGKFFKPALDPLVVGLIERLKKSSRVVCGTNTIEPHYEIHQRLGHYGIFHAVYASHRMGVAKPDPEFFRFILEAEETAAAEAFFIDDDEKNVLSARGLGMESVHFKDPSALIQRIG